MIVILLVALVLLTWPTGPQRTPPSRPLDPDSLVTSCVQAGQRVGDCMSYLSWEL